MNKKYYIVYSYKYHHKCPYHQRICKNKKERFAILDFIRLIKRSEETIEWAELRYCESYNSSYKLIAKYKYDLFTFLTKLENE